MSKFGVFLGASIITLLSNSTFGYFENKMYCDIEDKKVIISIKNNNNTSKCSIYLDTISQLLSKKYNEIVLIYSYISQGEDINYWKGVLNEKKEEFLQIVSYKDSIKSAIGEFESDFFEQYKAYLQKPMQIYYSDLETEYYIMINQNQLGSGKNTETYRINISQLEQQMWNVNHILQASSLDEIMEIVPSYIYLKKQLSGK